MGKNTATDTRFREDRLSHTLSVWFVTIELTNRCDSFRGVSSVRVACGSIVCGGAVASGSSASICLFTRFDALSDSCERNAGKEAVQTRERGVQRQNEWV